MKKTPRLPVEETSIHLPGTGRASVILIHGLTGTPNEVRFLANFLNKKGYTVFCPRLANHGEPLSILKTTKWQQFYGSVRELMTEIGQSKACGPVFAAGLSMGALLALLLAAEFPDFISGVCCLSPTLFYDGWNVPWTKNLLPLAYATPLKHMIYFQEEPPYGIKNNRVRRRIHEHYQNADLHQLNGVAQFGYPFFPLTLLCELNRLVKHLEKKLPAIRTPVQCIQAQDDDMTSVKNSQFICDHIQSSVKEIFLLYNSYHVITADNERTTVAEHMEAFFTRVRTGHYGRLETAGDFAHAF